MNWEDVQPPDWAELKKERPLQLVQELKLTVQNLIAGTTRQGGTLLVLTDETPLTATLCYCLEHLLSHGMKDVGFFSSTVLWHYVENLARCLPGSQSKDLLHRIRETSKTDTGRGRLFLRAALNEGSLQEYLSALRFNEQLTKKYFHNYALLRTEDNCAIVMLLLESLAVLKFRLAVKPDKELDKEDYWSRVKLVKPTAPPLSTLLPRATKPLKKVPEIRGGDTPPSHEELPSEPLPSPPSSTSPLHESHGSPDLSQAPSLSLQPSPTTLSLEIQETQDKAEMEAVNIICPSNNGFSDPKEHITEGTNEEVEPQQTGKEPHDITKASSGDMVETERSPTETQESVAVEKDEPMGDLLPSSTKENAETTADISPLQDVKELNISNDIAAPEREGIVYNVETEDIQEKIEIKEELKEDLEYAHSEHQSQSEHMDPIDELSSIPSVAETLVDQEQVGVELSKAEELKEEFANELSGSEESEQSDDSSMETEGSDGSFSEIDDAPLPPDWRKFSNGEGRNYYYNIRTRETVWKHPGSYGVQVEELPASPEDSPINSDKGNKPVMPTTRPTWAKDASTNFCGRCRSKFSLTKRKHHCRLDGKIYCKQCMQKIQLPTLGYTEPVFVCKSCLDIKSMRNTKQKRSR